MAMRERHWNATLPCASISMPTSPTGRSCKRQPCCPRYTYLSRRKRNGMKFVMTCRNSTSFRDERERVQFGALCVPFRPYEGF